MTHPRQPDIDKGASPQIRRRDQRDWDRDQDVAETKKRSDHRWPGCWSKDHPIIQWSWCLNVRNRSKIEFPFRDLKFISLEKSRLLEVCGVTRQQNQIRKKIFTNALLCEFIQYFIWTQKHFVCVQIKTRAYVQVVLVLPVGHLELCVHLQSHQIYAPIWYNQGLSCKLGFLIHFNLFWKKLIKSKSLKINFCFYLK